MPMLAQTAVHEFWVNQAATPKRTVRLLTENNNAAGGSLVAEIENRYLVWEAWGDLDRTIILPSMDAIAEACERAHRAGSKLSIFYDMSRVEDIATEARETIIELRKKLTGALAPDRAAIIFGSTVTQIMYNMASLLQPAPWDERVFREALDALNWLQDPQNRALRMVDGFHQPRVQ